MARIAGHRLKLGETDPTWRPQLKTLIPPSFVPPPRREKQEYRDGFSPWASFSP